MKAFRRICGIITTLAVIAVVVLAILLVGVRVVGLTPYAVLSGSMEPTYHVGSLIYVRKVAPEDVQIGDPITFVVNEDLLVATHRVVDIAVETTGTETVKDEETGEEPTVEVPLDEPAYYFYTKGDANDAEDGSPVYYKNVVGTPVFSIPYLGYLSNWLQTREGMIMGVSIALVLLILTFLPDMLHAVDDDGTHKKGKKRRRGRRRKRRKRPRPAETERSENAVMAEKPLHNRKNHSEGGYEYD